MSRILLVNNTDPNVIVGGHNSLLDLCDYLGKYNPEIIDANDEKLSTLDTTKYEAIILTGGRRWPNYEDVKPEQDMINNCSVPMFGVCYGAHQIAYCFGASPRFKMLPHKRWGWQNVEIINDDDILDGIDKRFWAYEAHKFVMGDFTDDFELLAESSDGPEMFKIKGRPIYGVQFHPEYSDEKLDPNAKKILDNFLIKYVTNGDS